MKVERPPAMSSAAPTRENSRSHQADPGRLRRHEQPGLGQHHEQRVLPEEGGFAGHVRPGQQTEALAGRQVAVVRHEGPGAVAGQRRLHHRVAAGDDGELRPLGQLRPAPAGIGGQFGGGGMDIDLGQRRRRGGDAGGGGEAQRAQVAGDRFLPPGRLLGRLGQPAVEPGQSGTGEAVAIGHGLAMDRGESPAAAAGASRSSFSPAAAGSSAR